MIAGTRITREELLAPVARWTWQTKFWICEGLFRKRITFDEAMSIHHITEEELNRWYDLYQTRGAIGLRSINRKHRGSA